MVLRNPLLVVTLMLRDGQSIVVPGIEYFQYYCDVVRLARCGHSFIHPSTQGPRAGDPDFTPAHKDRAPGTPIQWNGRARFSFSAYTNSEML
jgi:hypothetical protein